MEKNNIKIHTLTSKDIKYINQIESLQNDYEHSVISNASLVNDLNSTDIDTNYYIVLLLNDNVIGFAGINILYDHADILGIVVKSDLSNNGLGTMLLQALIDKCVSLNLEKLFLEVRKFNSNAIHLYEKLGFSKINERKGYYDKGIEDAIIYCLKVQK